MAISKEIKIILAILLVFIVVRLPGVSLPYHQDEWKNVNSSSSVQSAGLFFGHGHPPLMQVWFVTGYALFGENQFRMFPLLFSLGTALLLFFIARRRFGETAALFATALFTLSFYSIWGSLMADVDGSVIPFFFLLTVYLYDKLNSATDSKSIKKWLTALILVCLIGFLIKLSFILVIGTLFADFLWNNRKTLTFQSLLKYCVGMFSFGFLYLIILYFIQVIYPTFSIDFMLGHAEDYTDKLGRNWIQIVVQGIKAVFYLSPLLIVPLLFTSKEVFKQTRIFFWYLIFGFIFYFALFDFSRGALDKYLMFVIAPLAIISGAIIAKIFRAEDFSWRKLKWPIGLAIMLAIILMAANFLSHSVMPLYPKTEWFSRVLQGRWNFLNPFNGGSGPLGFYVSFLFIAVFFIISLTFGLIGLIKRKWRPACIIFILIIGVVYNAVFAEELMFGKINGNAPQVLRDSVAFIKKSDSIKRVITYNDTGNQYLSAIKKYEGRIYATPDSESGYKKRFSEFNGQYLIIDIPHLYENGFYGKFFTKCRVLFETASGRITGRVYDCPNSKRIIDSI
ncbi:MAG: glycosyltransferase family 39 protein [Patescibacteria group bacterium]